MLIVRGNPLKYVDVNGHNTRLGLHEGFGLGVDPITVTYLLYEMFRIYSENPTMQYVVENGDKGVACGNEIKNGSSRGNGKIPNPDGKKGGQKHQELIKKIGDYFIKKGLEVKFEKYVQIVNGFKNSRFGDILITNPKTSEEWIIQVGKQTLAGLPVAREIKAMIDLVNKGYKVFFVPYN